MEDVWLAIGEAEIIIADCTGRNPNVFYEVGLAHALSKETILITRDLDDIPFDLRHLRIIAYSFSPRGMKDFETVLRRTLDTIKQSADDAQS